MLIEYIDVIARKKQRDVLYIYFHPENWGDYEDNSWRDYDFEKDTRRTEVIAWLAEHDIHWQMCGPVASEYGWRSYIGEIYIDVPFDEDDPVYQLIRDYLEKPDGTMRDERIRFSFGNLSTSIDEYLENALKCGISANGVTHISNIVQRVREGNPDSAKLDSIGLNDPAVYQLLQSGDTDGVIQLESTGIQKLLRTMQPTCFEDIVALCAVYRPTALADGTTDKLITRKRCKAPIEYLHPKLKPILQKTYGVILYKEQIKEIVEILAGFSSGDAQKFLEELYRTFPEEAFDWPLIFVMECSRKNKISPKEAQKIYDLMKASVNDLFQERKASGHALTAYYCAFLKVYFPEEFKAAWDGVKPGWDERKTIMKRPTGKVDISKFLSLVLRHKPEIVGIKLDKAGWIDIAELAEKGSKAAGIKLTLARIRKVAAASDKQRFAISDDGLRIRANQGHSITIDLGPGNADLPEFLYHGTSVNKLLSIREQGLVPGNRLHVHLSLDKETAEVVGKRHGKAVVLTILTGRMRQDGFKFFQSENGVWLTDHVPEEYIIGHKKVIG